MQSFVSAGSCMAQKLVSLSVGVACLPLLYPASVLSRYPNAELRHFHSTSQFKDLILLHQHCAPVVPTGYRWHLFVLVICWYKQAKCIKNIRTLIYRCLLTSLYRIIYQRQCRVCLACCWYAVHNLYEFVGAAVLLVQVHELISDILGAI